ncbi:hypothetical protein TNCV_1512431 [Trichonephila clavipes]|nr:hypothetical protein TNCV_1512431 [Trichonephila clavipes]
MCDNPLVGQTISSSNRPRFVGGLSVTDLGRITTITSEFSPHSPKSTPAGGLQASTDLKAEEAPLHRNTVVAAGLEPTSTGKNFDHEPVIT